MGNKDAFQKGGASVVAASNVASFKKGQEKCNLRAALAKSFAKNGMTLDMLDTKNVKSAA